MTTIRPIPRAGAVFLLLALLVSLNGHLVILQGIGWAGMFKDHHARSGNVEEALSKTFSGDFPCELCALVSAQLKEMDSPGNNPRADRENNRSVILVLTAIEPVRIAKAGVIDRLAGINSEGTTVCGAVDVPPPKV